MAITFIDVARQGVRAWYEQVPFEQTSGGTEYSVGSLQVLGDRADSMTLESLLQAIVRASGSLDYVTIICHSEPDAIVIPLFDGFPSVYNTARREHLAMLSGSLGPQGRTSAQDILDDETDAFAGAPAQPSAAPTSGSAYRASPEQIADYLFPGYRGQQRTRVVQRIAGLRSLMEQVQRRQIGTLVFRSCNMGQNQETMREVGRFFGAQQVNAPQHRDAFGTANRIQPMGAAMASPGAGWAAYVEGGPRPGVVPLVYLHVQLQGSTMTVEGRTQDAATVSRWMNLTFRPNRAFQPPAPLVQRAIASGFPIHGIWVPPGGGLASVPSSSQFQGGLVLPGMPEYVQSLVMVAV